MMETLSQRLSVCQDKILEHYETDSTCLSDHIQYWKLIRLECAVFYKAREMGIKTLNHQVVPTQAISKAKAMQAIELQLMLETLNTTEYRTETWTLQETSIELYTTVPQGCFKKHGVTVEVQFDGDKQNTMHYTNWTHIYILEDSICTVVKGLVNYKGIYYVHQGVETYYVNFREEAKKYGKKNIWEVHVGGQVIVCPESVFSSTELSTAEIATQLHAYNTTETHTKACSVGTTETQKTNHKRLRGGTELPCNPTKRVRLSAVDSVDRGVYSTSDCTNKDRCGSCSTTTPIVHLKGDANTLKCLRYRLGKYKALYQDASSTWRWTCTNDKKQIAIVTLTYTTKYQRDKFLTTVKIPNTVTVSKGYMSI
uniref:Regulatory protein E2 n=1 Tax=Human papillomavirus 35 TaxID=10587 RepID=I6WAM1_HPV35|nr:early protein [human papillomavirus 35]